MALAKTTRPTSNRVVARPRLFSRLDRAASRPLTWIWSPAGAGKTTLVSSYIAQHRLRHVWYRVDEGDRDVATLFYYLGRAAPKRRRPMPWLAPEFRQALSLFARHFFRELAERLKPPFALVFDDLQEVGAEADLNAVLCVAAEEMPIGGRLVAISRGEPPTAFARMRTARRMEVIGWPELRFTRSESARLVRTLAPRRAIASARLHQVTDGWAAGLVLALEQAAGVDGPDDEPFTRPPPALLDYFAAEVLRPAEPALRAVLLQCALLPHVPAAIAVELTGEPRAALFLAELQRQNFFTTRRARNESDYEFHPLFREFLVTRAEVEYGAERCAAIRSEAGRLAESAGLIETAAGLYLDARDWRGLTVVVCRHAPVLLSQGRAQTLMNWLSQVPPDALEAHAWLLYWRGICALGWQHEQCRRDCEHALRSFRQDKDSAGMHLAWASIVLSYIFESSSAPLDPWIGLLDELLVEAPDFASPLVEQAVALSMLAAITWRQPGHPAGPHWAQRACALAANHPDPMIKASTAICSVLYYWQRCDLQAAFQFLPAMRQLSTDPDVPPSARLQATLTVCCQEFVSALPSLRTTVADALHQADCAGVEHSAKYALLSIGIFAVLGDGDLKAAAAWNERLGRAVGALGAGFRFWHRFFATRMALLQGDVQRAEGGRAEMLRLVAADGWPLDETIARLLSAQVLQLRGETSAARAEVEAAWSIARRCRSPYYDFMISQVDAELCFATGRESEGLRALRTWSAIGSAHRLNASHVWNPGPIAMLCARALDAGIETEWVRALIRHRGLVPDASAAEVEDWPRPLKVYTLGRFGIVRDDRPLRFSGKVQRRPLALLKAIIAFGGRGVRDEVLMDTLWPDSEGPAARIALATAIHRLRRLLGHEGAIVRQPGEVSLDNRYCWVDLWAVERMLARAETQVANGPAGVREANAALVRAMNLYQGAFLQQDADFTGATAVAHRLRRRLLQQWLSVAKQWAAAHDWQEAANAYEQALRVDPCAEDACCELMGAFHRLGRRSDVVAAYLQCRDALAKQLRVVPSARTEAEFRRLSQ